MEMNVITSEKLEELKKEHKKLVEIDRPSVIQEIKEAREQGDLSENAEFDAARDKQAMIEDRITEIENIIQTSKVISSSKTSNSKVKIGSEVTIKNLKTNESEKYTIVGSLEADPFENKISNISPLGSVLIGKELGSIVKVEVKPAYEVKVTKIN